MKTLFFTILAVISLIPAHGEDLEPTVNLLLRRIRAELPKGWTASYYKYDKKDAWLRITREEAVSSMSAVPNGPVEKSAPGRFLFSIRVMTVIPPNEYRRLSAENTQIQKEATALYEDLISKNVSHKFDSFWPRNDEEKTAVAKYEALKKSLHWLPDFYFDDISLAWGYNSPAKPMISVIDDAIRDECTRVQEKVTKLLSKYDGA